MFKQIIKITLIFILLVFSCNNSKTSSSKEPSPIVPDDPVILDSSNYIIIDHTAVDKYSDIPQEYIDIIKSKWVQVLGESHSLAYRNGVELLEALDSRYQAEGQEREDYQEDGNYVPLPPTDKYLRISRFRYSQYGWTGWSTGEEDFWTSRTAIDSIKNNIEKANGDTGIPVFAVGFGWCWDMTNGDLSLTVDTEYNVHWAGTLEILDSESITPFGIDENDSVISLKDYCNAVKEMQESTDKTIVFFTTGPVDGGANTEEKGYQRWIKHEYIRQWVKDNGGYLFDYADILCWNNSGEQNIISWNGHNFPAIHTDNSDNGDTGAHIDQDGELRIAKALWTFLAVASGWDPEE